MKLSLSQIAEFISSSGEFDGKAIAQGYTLTHSRSVPESFFRGDR